MTHLVSDSCIRCKYNDAAPHTPERKVNAQRPAKPPEILKT